MANYIDDMSLFSQLNDNKNHASQDDSLSWLRTPVPLAISCVLLFCIHDIIF